MKKFAVCFRGGMAKGAGAIGFVRFLQEEGLDPYIYSGSSSGAMISAGYALGLSWEKILEGFETIDFKTLIDIKSVLRLNALVSRKNIEDALINFAGAELCNAKIENMDKRFIAFASNLKTQSIEYIQKGKLSDALIYSSAYPVIFEKPKKNLIDGDFLFDYSNEFFKHKGADVVIGCGFNLSKRLFKSRDPLNKFLDAYRLVQYNLLALNNQVHKPDYEIIYDAYNVGFIDFKKSHLLADKVYKHLKKHKREFYKILE